ncbi:hypothetical protein HNS40_04725, partial [Lentimicrobium sp. S6]|nr:hypothetical protein [Lentimicrobium sp. S6]
PAHTGMVGSDGDGDTWLNVSAIEVQTYTSSLSSTDKLIFARSGSQLKSTKISDLKNYMQNNLDFGSGGGGTISPWVTSGSNIYRSSGNVGIGISSPQEKLHVNGTIQVEDGIKMIGSTNKLVYGESSSSIFQISKNVFGKGVEPPPAGTQTNIITIDANNRVGIGTDSPSAQLDVDGDVRIDQELIVQSTANILGDIDLGLGSTTISFGSSTVARTLKLKSKYSYGSKGVVRGLAITAAGNVGIGIDNPSKSLEVNGTTKTSGFQMTSGSDLDGKILQSDASGNASWVDPGTLSGVGIWDETNSVANYYGSVGIGTANVGTHKLVVAGSINATLIKVTETVPSSDYVFESDYSLMPLNELETFVKTNKHLPEVMSAEEFAKDGYSLGEMDDILLRKVEELTLYVIDQDKTINTQQETLEQQQILLEKQQKLIDQLLEAQK